MFSKKKLSHTQNNSYFHVNVFGRKSGRHKLSRIGPSIMGANYNVFCAAYRTLAFYFRDNAFLD